MNTSTSTGLSVSGRTVIRFHGSLQVDNEEPTYSCCGSKMHVNNHLSITLRHLPFGSYLSDVTFTRIQYVCPRCGSTRMQYVSIKAPGHRITTELYQYVCELLACGTYTNEEVAELTGLGKNVIKAIDKTRLQEFYTTRDG